MRLPAGREQAAPSQRNGPVDGRDVGHSSGRAIVGGSCSSFASALDIPDKALGTA
jgi:hypothetical protein